MNAKNIYSILFYTKNERGRKKALSEHSVHNNNINKQFLVLFAIDLRIEYGNQTF